MFANYISFFQISFATLLITICSHALPAFLTESSSDIVADFSNPAVASTFNKSELKPVSPRETEVRIHLYKQQLTRSYALRLDSPLPPKVLINSAVLEVEPLQGDDGWYYIIDPYYLKAGLNTLRFVSSDGGSLGLQAVQVASLDHTAEQAHFRRFLKKPSTKAQPPTDPEQLKYDAAHYILDITPSMSSTYLIGTLTMTATSLDSSLSTVVLDLDDNAGLMNVTAVDGGPSTVALAYSHNGSLNRLSITLPAAVPVQSTFTVRVFYSGNPRSGGGHYIRTTHAGDPIVYTMSEPYGARRWWPCKDIPEDKATMDIAITCPTDQVAVSNGTLQSLVDQGNGTHQYSWSESYPMVTYLACFYCSNYQRADGVYTARNGSVTMEVNHYGYPEVFAYDSAGLPGMIEVIGFFADTYGEYPFLREKYCTVTYAGTPMEHQTCSGMRSYQVGPDGQGWVNVHELAHQWFGDCITMDHFNHLWLNEGFATYSEALFVEWRDGKSSYHSYVNNWGTSDAYPIVSSQADSFSGGIVYRKGGWVLHMLRNVVGDTAFFQSLRDYMAHPDYQYGTALSADFQAVVENASGAGTDLSWFFDQWLYRASRPTYEWYWNYHIVGSDTIIDVSIEQIQTDLAYRMPIDFIATDVNGATAAFTLINSSKSETLSVNIGPFAPDAVSFDPENWILGTATEIAPDRPTLTSVEDTPAGSDALTVSWQANTDIYTDGYQLYMSSSLTGWMLVADKADLPKSATTFTVNSLTPGNGYYFKIRAVGTSGSSSGYSDVYGGVPDSGLPSILLVDGYDRWDTQSGRDGSYVGAYYHGAAISAFGASFESCDNGAVGSEYDLTDYDIVIWVLGEEASTSEAVSSSEQTLITAFLAGGGSLFISGAEIGWDLVANGSVSDATFYNTILKAGYAGDDSGTLTVQGTGGSIFDGIGSFNFDFYYIAEWPDQLTPLGGASVCLTYTGGSGGNAAIQYSGAYKLVNMGFGFETIDTEANRNTMMAAILTFFGATSEVGDWRAR
jgi:Peptidase family M1 domain/Peptidase M1 N-terminal domain/Fibronectin type III domain